MKKEAKLEKALRRTEECIKRVENMVWDCDEDVYDSLLDIRHALKAALKEESEK